MKAQVISFRCVLKTKLGRFISATFNHDVITLPNAQDPKVLAGLVEGLQDIKGGERRRINVGAERAYGFYDPDKVVTCSRDEWGERRLRLGDKVKVDLNGRPALCRVTALTADEVTLDANHPLAGEDLVFEVEAVDVREARPEDFPDSPATETQGLLH